LHFFVLRLSIVAVQAELASLQSLDKTTNWTALELRASVDARTTEEVKLKHHFPEYKHQCEYE